MWKRIELFLNKSIEVKFSEVLWHSEHIRKRCKNTYKESLRIIKPSIGSPIKNHLEFSLKSDEVFEKLRLDEIWIAGNSKICYYKGPSLLEKCSNSFLYFSPEWLFKISTYKNDMILWVVGIRTADVESVAFHWLNNSYVIPAIEELRKTNVLRKSRFDSSFAIAQYSIQIEPSQWKMQLNSV